MDSDQSNMGYIFKALSVFSFISLPFSSHDFSASIVQPTISLSILRNTTSIYSFKVAEQAIVCKPYNKVGVTTASNKRKRDRKFTWRLHNAYFNSRNLIHAHWIRKSTAVCALFRKSPENLRPKYLCVSMVFEKKGANGK